MTAAISAEKALENKKTLRLMTGIALVFAFIVTKEVVVPKVILYGGLAAGAVYLLVQAMKRPELVTYAFVVYLPFSRVLAGDMGGLAATVNLTNLLLIYCVWVWMTGRYQEGEAKWLSSPLNVPIILFMLLGMVSVVRGVMGSNLPLWTSITYYKRWFTPFFLYFLVLNTVKKRDMVHNVFKIIMIVGTIVGLMAEYDYMNAAGSSLEKMRIGGICDQPNQMAGFFVFYMFLLFALFLLNMGKGKYWLLNLPFLIQFRGIMVTFSRGGYLGFAAGLYVLTFFRSKILFVFLLFISVIIYFHPQLLPAGIRYRMTQTVEQPNTSFSLEGGVELGTGDLDASAGNRVKIWKGAMVMIKDHPFWGVGYGLFPAHIKYYWKGGEIDAHNQYFSIACEMGVPALIIFMIILIMMFWSAWMLYLSTPDSFAKAMALGFMGGIGGLLVVCVFGSRLNTQEVSSYLWIMAAMIQRLRMLDKTGQGLDGEASPAPVRRKTLDSCWKESSQ